VNRVFKIGFLRLRCASVQILTSFKYEHDLCLGLVKESLSRHPHSPFFILDSLRNKAWVMTVLKNVSQITLRELNPKGCRLTVHAVRFYNLTVKR